MRLVNGLVFPFQRTISCFSKARYAKIAKLAGASLKQTRLLWLRFAKKNYEIVQNHSKTRPFTTLIRYIFSGVFSNGFIYSNLDRNVEYTPQCRNIHFAGDSCCRHAEGLYESCSSGITPGTGPFSPGVQGCPLWHTPSTLIMRDAAGGSIT